MMTQLIQKPQARDNKREKKIIKAKVSKDMNIFPARTLTGLLLYNYRQIKLPF